MVSLCTSMKAVQGSSRFRWMWSSDEWQALVGIQLGSEFSMGRELNTAFSSCLTLLQAADKSRRSYAWPTIFLFSPVCPTAPGTAAAGGSN